MNMKKSSRSILAAFLAAICLLGAACSKQTDGAPAGSVPEPSSAAASSKESAESPKSPGAQASPESTESSQVTPPTSLGESSAYPLSQTAQELCKTYFKSGDFSYRLELVPGMQSTRRQFTLTASKRDLTSDYGGWSSSMRLLNEWEFPYQEGVSSFQLTSVQGNDSNSAPTVLLNGKVLTLTGSGEADGDYYPIEESLHMPEAFFRPLNDTDLIGLKASDLRLLRNQFYAVYGRKFTSPDLREAFGSKPWYQGRIETEQFNEGLLGGLVKRNIAFLMNAEENYDDQAAAAAATAYSALPKAPYLSLLPDHGEILVTISPSRDTVTDEGLYYVAKGSIQVPITITAQQYNDLYAGGTLEITVNELTGEKNTLKKSSNTNYGEFCLGEESYGDYVFSSYDPKTDLYTLWANSADTRFKPVYEGDIYVLKGATEEYYRNFESPKEQVQEGAGNYRVIDFDEPEIWASDPYTGNILISDDKGYVKALYFWGD